MIFALSRSNVRNAKSGVEQRSRGRINVNDHTFDKVAGVSDGIEPARNGVYGAKFTAAVAVKHTSEVEFGRGQQTFEFGVEKVGKRTSAVGGSADRLVRNFDLTVKVFERGNELNVVRAVSGRKVARFVARSDAAVDTDSGGGAHFFTPDVNARLLDFTEKRVDFGVKKFGYRTEID